MHLSLFFFFVIIHDTTYYFILGSTFGEFIHFQKKYQKALVKTQKLETLCKKISLPKNSIIKAG